MNIYYAWELTWEYENIFLQFKLSLHLTTSLRLSKQSLSHKGMECFFLWGREETVDK